MPIIRNLILAVIRFFVVEFTNLVWLAVSILWAMNVPYVKKDDLYFIWLTLVLLMLTFGRGMNFQKRKDRLYQVGKTRLERWAKGKEAGDE